MTIGPPERRRALGEHPSAALDYEIAQEIAGALGRLGRTLEAALGNLTQFDEARAGRRDADDVPVDGLADRAERQRLIEAAGKALWLFVVQREVCGLRDTGQLLQDYKVPVEVRRQAGIVVPMSLAFRRMAQRSSE